VQLVLCGFEWLSQASSPDSSMYKAPLVAVERIRRLRFLTCVTYSFSRNFSVFFLQRCRNLCASDSTAATKPPPGIPFFFPCNLLSVGFFGKDIYLVCHLFVFNPQCSSLYVYAHRPLLPAQEGGALLGFSFLRSFPQVAPSNHTPDWSKLYFFAGTHRSFSGSSGMFCFPMDLHLFSLFLQFPPLLLHDADRCTPTGLPFLPPFSGGSLHYIEQSPSSAHQTFLELYLSLRSELAGAPPPSASGSQLRSAIRKESPDFSHRSCLEASLFLSSTQPLS